MSVKYMGQIWDLDLPHNQAWVLMAMVDHANHAGEHIHPGLELIAWKTGYQLRQVQRIVKELVKLGLLEVTRPSKQHQPTEYRACLDRAPRKEPYVRDDKMSPLEPQTRQNVIPEPSRDDKKSPLRDDKMSPLEPQTRQNVIPEPSRDDIAMSPEPWGDGGGGGESPPLPPNDHNSTITRLRQLGVKSNKALAEFADLPSAVIDEILAEVDKAPYRDRAALLVSMLRDYQGGWRPQPAPAQEHPDASHSVRRPDGRTPTTPRARDNNQPPAGLKIARARPPTADGG